MSPRHSPPTLAPKDPNAPNRATFPRFKILSPNSGDLLYTDSSRNSEHSAKKDALPNPSNSVSSNTSKIPRKTWNKTTAPDPKDLFTTPTNKKPPHNRVVKTLAPNPDDLLYTSHNNSTSSTQQQSTPQPPPAPKKQKQQQPSWWELIAQDDKSNEDELRRSPSSELLKIEDLGVYMRACERCRYGREKGWSEERLLGMIDELRQEEGELERDKR